MSAPSASFLNSMLPYLFHFAERSTFGDLPYVVDERGVVEIIL